VLLATFFSLKSNDSGGKITPFSGVERDLVWNDEFTGSNLNSEIFPFSGPDRNLTWNDEFLDLTLNQDIWTIYIGNGCEEVADDGQPAPNCGFGNEELQSYEESNVYLESGSLVLEARLEETPLPNGNLVSSGKITSKEPYSVLYGRVEAKITLPIGTSGWPAFFLLPVNETYGAWPASGEIDILESYNIRESPNSTPILSSLHYGESLYEEGNKGQNGCVMMDGHSLGGEPHIFALEWAPESMKFYVDDFQFCEMTQWWTGDVGQGNSPYDQPFYIIIAFAIGGQVPQVYNLTDIPDGTFPMKYVIDYIRVYDATEDEMSWTNPFPGEIVSQIEAENSTFYLLNEPTSGPYHYDLGTGEQTPFSITAATVRIDMEHFDYGGEGVGYHDLDPDYNFGTNPLRPFDGVDLYEENIFIPYGSFKFGNSAGSYVKFMKDEWTSYSILVEDNYYFLFVEIRHSTLAVDATAKIIVDSKNCLDPISDGGMILGELDFVPSHVPSTDPSANYTLSDVSPCWQTQYWELTVLPPGAHTIVFCSNSDDLNISYMDFSPYQPVFDPIEGPGCE